MADFITYDWHVRKEPAVFHVDISFEEETPVYSGLLYCAIAASADGTLAFTPAHERRMLRVESKLLKAITPGHYMGYIHMEALRQYYFYVPDTVLAMDIVEHIAFKETKLCVNAGGVDEPDWLTYYSLLLPDAAKYQTMRNGACIEHQRTSGDALEKVRRLTFYVCFPTEELRQFFCDGARNVGFALGDASFEPEIPLSHVQALYALSSLDKAQVDALTTKAIRAAAPHGGELLRWTCPRMARKSPLA